MGDWHQLGIDVAIARLQTDPARGLQAAEISGRLATHGPNELVDRDAVSPWAIAWAQLKATMMVILMVAAILSAAMGDFKDVIVIMAIVVLNAVLGFTQEYRAEKAMAALKQMAVPTVKVVRGAQTEHVPSRELVPGDIVLLEAGDLVPADCRLLEAANLRVQEAAMTGESEPVEKDAAAAYEADTPLGDRRNMVYMGTVVTYGRGRAAVAETGMHTELGAIATMMQSVGHETTPLQRKLDQLGKRLAAVALVFVGVIFVLGLMRGEDLKLMLMTAIGVAVAAVPEGLPAVVTITLALGAQRMLRRNALIRKLPAVETLGSVTVICSDKTGTLTVNRMTVTVLDVAGHRADVAETLHHSEPSCDTEGPGAPPVHPGIALMLAAGALCNDATLQAQPEGAAHWHAQGDPTEAAIVVAAARLGLLKHELDQLMPRVAEAPFDSDRKRMTTVHTLPEHGAPEGAPSSAEAAALQALAGSRYVAVTKGAADMLAEASSRVWEDGCLKAMDESWRKRIADAGNDLAANGMRVLGVAMRPLDEAPGPANVAALETDLVFLGMVGIVDPPRTEAKDAVATCRAAGIRPVMITGDHPLTARHIARELGITAGEAVTTGRDLATMSGPDLQASTSVASVYARVSPEHKLSIVDALQAQGHIVAMTGDGVNDAPALKKADIGVAMGITGTDVSKEAADMVLLDDNFATIVAAVEEGRIIFDNTRKFVKYLMTTNASELALMLFGPLLGMPLPLLPLQILWINLVTDGLPGLALGVEPAERNVMKRGPYPPGESIFARGLGVHIVWVSLLMAAITLGVGYAYWRVSEPGSHLWQTMLFNTLALSQMAHVIAIRSSRDSLFRIGLLSNKPLLGAVILTLLGQMAVLYVPVLSGLLETNPLTLGQLALTFGLAAVVFVAVEIEKWWNRNHER